MTISLVKKNYSQTKVTAMVIDAKPACMTGGKSLPAEENDRVVDILNKLLPKYKNQTGLARAIGVEQPTLSNILRRVTGSGNQTVAGIANLLGVSEYDIRTGRVTVDDAGTIVRPSDSSPTGSTTAESDDAEPVPESDHSQAYPHDGLYETSYAIERYNQLAQWPDFVKYIKQKEPDMPDWAIESAGVARPFLVGNPTAEVILGLVRFIYGYSAPPANTAKKRKLSK